MSLITLWQKPIEEYALPDGSFVCSQSLIASF